MVAAVVVEPNSHAHQPPRPTTRTQTTTTTKFPNPDPRSTSPPHLSGKRLFLMKECTQSLRSPTHSPAASVKRWAAALEFAT